LNGKIKATGGESFYTPDGWKRAHDLKVGDRIHTLSGEAEEIVSKEQITANLRVYNIRVNRNHNFFVSPDGETGYLVHNK
jgi:intein/homing endonuclease